MTVRTEARTVLRLAGWTAYVSGVVAAIGLVFLLAMFASFAVGAKSPGLVFGWINDVLGVVGALLMLPLAVALHVLLRPHAPVLSGLAMLTGIGAMVSIIILQSLLVVGALTFQEEIGPVSIAFLVLVVWFVIGGLPGQFERSPSPRRPHGPPCRDVRGLPDLGPLGGPASPAAGRGAISDPGTGAERHLLSGQGGG